MRYSPGQLVTVRLPRPVRDCLRALGQSDPARPRSRPTAYGALQHVLAGRVQLALAAPACLRRDPLATELLQGLRDFPITVVTVKLSPEEVPAVRLAALTRGVSPRSWLVEEGVRLAAWSLSPDRPAGQLAARVSDHLFRVVLSALGSAPVDALGPDRILDAWRTGGPTAVFAAGAPHVRFDPADYLLSPRELQEAHSRLGADLAASPPRPLLPADLRSALVSDPGALEAAARGAPPAGMTAGAVWISARALRDASQASTQALAQLKQQGLPDQFVPLVVEALARRTPPADLPTAAEVLRADGYLRNLLTRALQSSNPGAVDSLVAALALVAKALNQLGAPPPSASEKPEPSA